MKNNRYYAKKNIRRNAKHIRTGGCMNRRWNSRWRRRAEASEFFSKRKQPKKKNIRRKTYTCTLTNTVCSLLVHILRDTTYYGSHMIWALPIRHHSTRVSIHFYFTCSLVAFASTIPGSLFSPSAVWFRLLWMFILLFVHVTRYATLFVRIGVRFISISMWLHIICFHSMYKCIAILRSAHSTPLVYTRHTHTHIVKYSAAVTKCLFSYRFHIHSDIEYFLYK